MFAAGSSVKKEGQLKKYSAGDLLLDHSKEIISKIEKDLKTKPDSTVVALYILFKKGIRIGDKKATRNGTKGLLSIEWGKEVFENPYGIKFDFLGKDSVHDDSLLEIKDKVIQDAIVKVWSKDVKLKTNKDTFNNYIVSTFEDIPFIQPQIAYVADTWKDVYEKTGVGKYGWMSINSVYCDNTKYQYFLIVKCIIEEGDRVLGWMCYEFSGDGSETIYVADAEF